MKIEASNVAMSSERTFGSYKSSISASLLTTADKAAALEFSEESKTMLEQMEEYRQAFAEEKKKNEQTNEERQKAIFEDLIKRGEKTSEKDLLPKAKSKAQLQLEILKEMLKCLNGIKHGRFADNMNKLNAVKGYYEQSMAMSASKTETMGISISGSSSASAGGSVAVGQGTKWTKTTVLSSFYGESEKTAFKTAGLVKTADGREINFGVTLEMSRSFCKKYESLLQSSYILTDPLVINLDTDIGSVTEQKFLFDIDTDGTKEEISFAGAGSGFLALDNNNDGIINDGSELFGTQSGDGFKDLAGYDEDGNGWIDEADEVFGKLKVWVKDEDGKDRLLNLKEAGVGAIYLDNASTEFSLNRIEDNTTDAVIRKTGIYLKENGDVGTIQHIDLAI